MSRVPIGGYNPLFNPVLQHKQPGAYMSMGDTAENVAHQWQVPREQQEAFAVASHRKAAAAQAEGRLAAEIVAIRAGETTVDTDGCIRPETSAEVLATLKPAFAQDGSVTAGTSSPLTDGCAAVLVTTEAYAERHGLTPLARVRSQAVAGCGPEIMGVGPINATRKALARAGVEIGAIDVVELNEAFSSQALASARDIGVCRRDAEHRRRRVGDRPSAGRHGRAHRGQGGQPATTHRRPLCAGDAVHRRRPGDRDRAGAGVMHIAKIGVVGAGVMGAGIAAQVANAGIPVVLLDIVPPGANDRSHTGHRRHRPHAEDRARAVHERRCRQAGAAGQPRGRPGLAWPIATGSSRPSSSSPTPSATLYRLLHARCGGPAAPCQLQHLHHPACTC